MAELIIDPLEQMNPLVVFILLNISTFDFFRNFSNNINFGVVLTNEETLKLYRPTGGYISPSDFSTSTRKRQFMYVKCVLDSTVSSWFMLN